jgi:Predicted integral membrane protein (DUF2269)
MRSHRILPLGFQTSLRNRIIPPVPKGEPLNRNSKMNYSVFKFLHVLGVILLIGNVTVTAFWKVLANRSKEARIVAYSQRSHGLLC